MKITLSLKNLPNFSNQEYILDVPSICSIQCDESGKPMLLIFKKVIQHLQDLGIHKKNIISFSDASFKYYIDDNEGYLRYVKQEIIIEMPAGIKADKAIIAYCLNHEKTVILTQDLYREYYKYLPDNDWIVERRVCVVIVNEEIYMIPMLDELTTRKSNKRKKGELDQKKYEETSVDTLNVLNIIETSDKDLEFDLYN